MLGLQCLHQPLPTAFLLAVDLLLRAHLDLREERCGLELHAIEHRRKELERLPLVLVAIVLLRIAAQVDALAQVVHRGEMIAPVLVERAQHHVLLDVAHQLRADARDLLVVDRLDGIDDTLAEARLVDLGLGLDPFLRREARIEVLQHAVGEAGEIPVRRARILRHELLDERIDGVGANAADRVGDLFLRHDLGALLVDHLALVVGDVVEQQQLLADIEVVRFDLALRLLDAAREHAALDHLALLHARHREQALGEVRIAEDPHQVVFHRQVEPARPRVALAARAAAQLVVDAAGLVAFGADDVQAAGGQHLVVPLLPLGPHTRPVGLRRFRRQRGKLGLEVAAEHDVGAAARHVGRDRDGARPAGLRHHVCLALVLLRVQHLVGDAFLLQQARQQFRGFDRGRADERRLFALDAVADVLDDRLELVVLVEIDEIGLVLPDHRPVRRYHDDLEAVDLQELGRFRVRGAGHARELAVDAEVVLERDRGDRLVLLAHAHAFLRLDRLVQAVRPAPARHGAAGELIDDDHLAAAHDVLDVAPVDRVRAQRRVEMVHQADVARVVEAVAFAQQARLQHVLLDVLVAFLGDMHLLLLLVDREIARAVLFLLARQARHELVDREVELGALLGGTRDDERRARLVDQDRVDLVDDRVGVAALYAVLEAEGEVVAQVIEAELVVRAVGDVAGVGRALLRARLRVPDHPDREAEETENRPHPVRVALREVLVDGDDMHALARQRIEVRRQRRDQRLALAGAHLGDLAFVQHEAADQLHVEVAHLQRAPRGLAHDGEGFDREVVELRALLQPRTELVRLGPQRVVRERLDRGLERGRSAHGTGVVLDEAVVAAAEDAREQCEHGMSLKKIKPDQGLAKAPAGKGRILYG
ncbi:MAG: hypothetical protein CMLOHMNK_02925 [Steroidobacteraceae bacterium]|nr:hypothetical protein [Steroidobacteraceae bacterium]